MNAHRGQREALETALRVLNAYTSHQLPSAQDEAYLRQIAHDPGTPGDELACNIIRAELRKAKLNKALAFAVHIE